MVVSYFKVVNGDRLVYDTHNYTLLWCYNAGTPIYHVPDIQGHTRPARPINSLTDVGLTLGHAYEK